MEVKPEMKFAAVLFLFSLVIFFGLFFLLVHVVNSGTYVDSNWNKHYNVNIDTDMLFELLFIFGGLMGFSLMYFITVAMEPVQDEGCNSDKH
jgi:hypothetical protein